MNPQLSSLGPSHFDEAAALIHRSLVHWYETHLQQGHRFGDRPQPYRIFPELYEALDPGRSIAAFDRDSGDLVGLCFCHPRPTHHSLGIVATHPDHGGKGIASAMVREALRRADADGKPARLISSLLNLDSFSLYTRHGFTPYAIYQDILFEPGRLRLPGDSSLGASRLRPATPADAPAIAQWEFQATGILREHDFAFLLGTGIGRWQAWVHTAPGGHLDGFLFCGGHPESPMIGPGGAASDEIALALLHRVLVEHPHRPLVALAPASRTELIAALYRWGGRNIELHVAQSTRPVPRQEGIGFPTFLPESA